MGRNMASFALQLLTKSRFLRYLAIASLSLLCYVNSRDGEFVFDDSEAIVDNKDVLPSTPLSSVFQNDFWGSPLKKKTSHKSYRPLTIMTFRWNYWLAGGLHPQGFHLTNIALHCLVSLIFMYLSEELFGQKFKNNLHIKPSFVSAVLFATHPVHTECVAGVVGRAELCSALFYFSAAIFYIKTRCTEFGSSAVSIFRVITVFLLTLVATLFKEQGITAIGVCMLLDFVWHYPLIRQCLIRGKSSKVDNRRITEQIGSLGGLFLRTTLLITSAIVLLYVRIFVLAGGPPTFQPQENPPGFSNSTLTKVLSYNYVYSLNAWLLLYPDWLCFDWSFGCVPLLTSLTDPRNVASLLLWLVLLALSLKILSGPWSGTKVLVSEGLALMITPFLPASNLFFLVGFVLAERVLYLPSAGYCILVGLGLYLIDRKWAWLDNIMFPLMLFTVLAFVMKSIQRSSDWKDEYTLFYSGLAVCPLNAKVHYNVGHKLASNGSLLEAEQYYRQAVQLYPDYGDALNNLGNLLKDKGESRSAEELLEKAVKSNPEMAAAWMNLGIVKNGLQKLEESQMCYLEAIQQRPKYPDAYYNLGNLFIDMGRMDDAVKAFHKVIEMKEDHISAWSNLALLLENTGREKESEEMLRRAITVNPLASSLYYSLGSLFGKTGRLEESIPYLKKAIELNPNESTYFVNLGVVYHHLNEYSLAKEAYVKAIQLDPSNQLAKDNLAKLKRSKKTNSF